MNEPKTSPKSPAITIGLSVNNGDKYIREAIDSERSQTVDDFEFMILDNASTDGLLAICLNHARRETSSRCSAKIAQARPRHWHRR
jgi:glycosyltransferase involved in cell wall biosynthesis